MKGSTITFSDSSGSNQIVGNGSSLNMKVSGQSYIYCKTGGTVGIKNTNPTATLDVTGSCAVSSSLSCL
eukprot:24344-Eustigmatos_ZCMA.PRE.1